MEGLTKKFTINIVDRRLIIGKIDEGQKKILHFEPDEALELIQHLKKKESMIQKLAKENESGEKA